MPEQIHTVATITARIRENLESGFSGVWIEGEISNHRLPGSGHHYFTLKDPFAQLSCVFFKGAAGRCPVRLADGMKVQAFGNISVYEARGQYQLVAQIVQPKGFGELQARFEALKRKLEEEGLFDISKKKPIPSFPETIGIVTSPTGAAIRDIINVLNRRAPWVRIEVYPVRVQGEGAAGEIAAAVRALSEAKNIARPDLIILARGGGSIEDLWAFNEEVVARAIADASIPVMTGVGHEIDFTIADFAADRREPTPSAAAENAVPDSVSLRRHLKRLRDTVEMNTASAVDLLIGQCEALRREVEAREPGRRVKGWMQTLDFLGERCENLLKGRLQQANSDLESNRRLFELRQPDREISRYRMKSEQLLQSMQQSARLRLLEKKRFLSGLQKLMQSLSPDSVLNRGFSLTTNEEGEIITEASQLKPGDQLHTKLKKGEILSRVEP